MMALKWFKFLLAKRYFDQGYGLTSYIKLALLLFGVSSLNVKYTLILGFVYGIACYFIGRWYIQGGFMETDHEISNLINPLNRQIRTKLKLETPTEQVFENRKV